MDVDLLETPYAGQAGRLVIASHPSAAISLLPNLVAEFLSQRPGVSVRLLARDSESVSQLLPNESVDIGIAKLPFDESTMTLVKYQVRCVAILPPRHALASRKMLTPKLLADYPLVASTRATQMLARLQRAFAADGVQANIVAEAEFFATACALVAAGVGWSLVDSLSAESFGHLGLVVRPFEPAIVYEIGAFHRRDREPSALATAFLELLDNKLNR